jgi:hypothetical protein
MMACLGCRNKLVFWTCNQWNTSLSFLLILQTICSFSSTEDMSRLPCILHTYTYIQIDECSFPETQHANIQHSNSCKHGLLQGRKLLFAVQDICNIVCDVRYIHTLEMQNKSTRPSHVTVWKALHAMLSGMIPPSHQFTSSSWFDLSKISCSITLNYGNL